MLLKIFKYRKPQEDVELVPVGDDPFKGLRDIYEAKQKQKVETKRTLQQRIDTLEGQVKMLTKYRDLFVDLFGDKITDEMWAEHFGPGFNYDATKNGPIVGYPDVEKPIPMPEKAPVMLKRGE